MEKPFIVAVDFDGVIAQYDGWKGPYHFMPPKSGAKESINLLRAHGIKVIIWTCRNNDTGLKDYLDSHGIGYDAINADVHPLIVNPEDNGRKVLADVYLDGRGIRFTDWNTAVSRILDIMTQGVI